MLGSVHLSSDGRTLLATAQYDDTVVACPVRLMFGSIEAVKVYEEFSDPAIFSPASLMPDPILRAVPWPFQEVIGSEWIARVLLRNGALYGREWRHFVIVTLDVTVHVMTDSPVEAQRLLG
ncbi:hypothetical protein ACFSLT_25120 [Novosphingobium resinovorum]|jgi:hypothetical protein